MNNISIVGRVATDIKLSTTLNGNKMARFNVAVRSDQKDENGENKTDFFSCIAWRDTAEKINKFFKKGSPIAIIGSMNSRKFHDQEKDVSYWIWELQVRSFSFTGINDTEQPKEEKKKETKPEPTPIQMTDDDLPF